MRFNPFMVGVRKSKKWFCRYARYYQPVLLFKQARFNTLRYRRTTRTVPMWPFCCTRST